MKLFHGDCLEVMRTLPDASIDCVLTDPPYGTTACKWDSVIPFEPMWKELKRIVKPRAAICLFGSQPFTSALVMSNPQMFKFELVWEKTSPTGFLDAATRPLKVHENILIFCDGSTTYNPQKWQIDPRFMDRRKAHNMLANNSTTWGEHWKRPSKENGSRYPMSVIPMNSGYKNGQHPTQKPVELLRYLIRTYTQEGETVLDFTMGSGSTGVACELENRNFIGIEKDAGYFEIAKKRIADVKAREPLFMEAAA